MGRNRNPEIYVKGYGKSIIKEDLKRWFKPFGKIICIQYKGPYSFIEFEDYYDAEYAVKQMQDKRIEGYRLIVEPSGQKKGRPRSLSRSRSNHKRKRYRSSSSSSSSSNSSSKSSSSSSSESGKKRDSEERRPRSHSNHKKAPI